MIIIHEEYLTDEQGHKKAVVVPINEWQQILDALEELDEIKAYDNSKKEPSESVPFEQALREIKEGKIG
jgi:hypothetical protein